MVCSVCGEGRRNFGACRSCGSRLCSTPDCRSPLPRGRADKKCCSCAKVRNSRHYAVNRDKENERSRKWRAANPDKARERDRERYARTQEKQIERSRKYSEANSDRIKERRRQRYAENSEQAKERFRVWYAGNKETESENSRKWREAHPDYQQRWHEANREAVAERNRKWRQDNPEKAREKCQRRRARKKGCVVSDADIHAVVEQAGGRCSLCNAFVPEELRHIDHIIPLSKGGPHSQENLQLLCYWCNSSKGAKLPGEVKPETWRKKPHPLQPFLLNPNWR